MRPGEASIRLRNQLPCSPGQGKNLPGLLPPRLFETFRISRDTFCGVDGDRKIAFIAPPGLGLLRIEVRLHPGDRDAVFFLELADTHFRQMELSFCIINDPAAPRFDVDVDESGHDNCFAITGA